MFFMAMVAFGQGVVTTVAGTDWIFTGDGKPAVNAPLSGLFGGPDLALDAQGKMYLCDSANQLVMKVRTDGILRMIAGNGLHTTTALGGDGGPAINASFYDANGLAVDGAGSIYIADTSNRRIRY